MRLGQCVPGRHVQACAGHERDAGAAQQPQPLREQLVEVNGSKRLALEHATQRQQHPPRGSQRQRRVGEDVGAAHGALVGVQVDQHQRRGRHHADAGAYRVLERHVDRACLHVGDQEGRVGEESIHSLDFQSPR
jgi:hypothetical protein